MASAKWIKAAAIIGFSVAAPATAQAGRFDVPPGRLEDVLIGIGLQARVTIILVDPDLAGLLAPGVHGRLSLHQALGAALRGSPAEAVFYDGAVIRIVRRHLAPRKPAPAPQPPPPAVPADIVVIASKQRLAANRYPGSVKIVQLEPGSLAYGATGNSESITRLLPAIDATNLGWGRNKFFVRGVADSSFTGQTQATTGQYLGDVRLNYNAPDPDLNLYDMQRIEVLVGPQGTLYGAGSLGGIIRLVPNDPDLRDLSATIATDIGFTRHGGTNRNGAAMLNLPLVDDRLAARLVVYEDRAAGYIDAPAQGRRNINGTTRSGQRFSLRAGDMGGWTIDAGFVRQTITGKDGQYTLRGDPPLTRDAPIPQPFRNAYALGYAAVRRQIGGADFFAVTSVTRHRLASIFDATGLDGSSEPIRSADRNRISLVSQEARLSGGGAREPWVIGVSLLASSSTSSLAIHPATGAALRGETANTQDEAAIFGKVSHALTPTLTGTIGGRLTIARSNQHTMVDRTQLLQRSSRTDGRFAGTLGLDWHPRGSLSLYAQLQQGYRPGGLGIALSGSGLTSHKFATDNLVMAEAGLRLGNATRDRFSTEIAIFAADWRDIQADLIVAPGLPYTANIGRGFITGLDATFTWRPAASLALSLSAFLNESDLSHPATGIFSPGEEADASARALPNIARNGARVAAAWTKQVSGRVTLKAGGSLRYVGPSHLGFGSLLDIRQGNYLVADATTSLAFERFAVSVNVSNLGDIRGNTFAYGNPFGLAQRNQITPLRPRTISLGISARF